MGFHRQSSFRSYVSHVRGAGWRVEKIVVSMTSFSFYSGWYGWRQPPLIVLRDPTSRRSLLMLDFLD
jgi:hypothetical protein